MSLSVKSLSFSYPKREVLKDISFTLGERGCIAILGTNGAGKSTMLKNINGILKPKSGAVYIGEEDTGQISGLKMAQEMGYISQSRSTMRTTVFDAVLLGRKPYISWDVSQRDLDIVDEVLDTFDLTEFALRHTDELSGGELQKVGIARALAQDPKILLMDEPTSNLDLKNQMDVIDIIRRIVVERGIAVVVTMHDLNLALRFADRFLMLKGGEVFALGGEEIITSENIKEVYDVQVEIVQLHGNSFVIPTQNGMESRT